MNRHYCRALIAIPFIVAGALPLARLSSTCVAAQAARSTQSSQEGGAETITITPLPDLTTTTAGEPLLYLSTPNPVISSDILTVPPGGVTRWMTHPVPVYLYTVRRNLRPQRERDAGCRSVRRPEAVAMPLSPDVVTMIEPRS
jgi:hypothetical protein